MKYLILLFLILLSGCIGSTQENDYESKVPEDNPCKDELYLKLKKKNLDSLSEREFQYFTQKEKECAEFTKMVYQTGPSKQIAKTYSTNSDVLLPVIIIILSLTGLVYLITNLNK